MPRLAYYGQQWPFPQGASAGPYVQFPGPLRGARPTCIIVGRRRIEITPGRRVRPCTQCCARPQRRLGALGDAGLPAGSSLSYSATWSNPGGTAQSPFADYTTIANDIEPDLKAQGIVIDSKSGNAWYQTGYAITLNVHTTIDRNSPNDVKAVIDHVIYAKEAGVMPQSSITTAQLAQQIPSTPAGTPLGSNPSAAASDLANAAQSDAAGDPVGAAYWMKKYQIDSGISPPFDLASWLSGNLLWVALIGGGALVIKELA